MTLPRGAWREFLQAATRPSRYALLTIVLLNVIFLSAILLLVTPSRMATSLPAYLAGSGTFDEHVTGAALRLAGEKPGQTLVVTLGASAIREALDASDLEEALKKRMTKKRGIKKVTAYNLATGRQSLYDSIALAEKIPIGSAGVVLLSMGPSRLTRPPSELEQATLAPRLGFRSDAVEALARARGIDIPPRFGVYPIDNMRFLAPRLTTLAYRLVIAGPQPRRAHMYLQRPPQRGKQWLRTGRKIAKRFQEYGTNAAHNFDLVNQLVALIRGRTKMTVALIDHPANPRFLREFAPEGFIERHRRLVTEAANHLKTPYLSLNELADLEESEFYDWCHLRDPIAIQRCADAIAEKIAPLLTGISARERPR